MNEPDVCDILGWIPCGLCSLPISWSTYELFTGITAGCAPVVEGLNRRAGFTDAGLNKENKSFDSSGAHDCVLQQCNTVACNTLELIPVFHDVIRMEISSAQNQMPYSNSLYDVFGRFCRKLFLGCKKSHIFKAFLGFQHWIFKHLYCNRTFFILLFKIGSLFRIFGQTRYSNNLQIHLRCNSYPALWDDDLTYSLSAPSDDPPTTT